MAATTAMSAATTTTTETLFAQILIINIFKRNAEKHNEHAKHASDLQVMIDLPLLILFS